MPSILNQILDVATQVAPLVLTPKTPTQSLDFAGIGASLSGQIDTLIQAIQTNQIPDRIAAISQAEQAVYAFQRLPQNKQWKSKDNAAFKTLESQIIDKLNQLRNTVSPTAQTGNGQIITANGQVISTNQSNTNTQLINGIDNKTLGIGAGLAVLIYFITR